MTRPTILYNGQIFTLDKNQPHATAVAVNHGRVQAVGSDEEIKLLTRPDTEQINLEGACITPGLVDAHCHFQWYALSLRQVNLLDVPSLSEAQHRVQAKISDLSPGEWLQGRGWKNQQWADSRLPHKDDLDGIVPDHPTLLRDKSGHTGWVNSLALKIAGITSATPDPEGGEIGRDEQGEPTGILYENAIELVRWHIPTYTNAQIVESMAQAQANCWAVGLTGLHDFDGRASFEALQTLHRQQKLGLRIYKNIPAALIDHAIALGLQTDFGDDWLRIGGIKIFADGALGGKTALMVEPYENEPQNRGIAVTDKEEMYAIASRASANGLSVTVHAIGDKAIHDILDVYEAVREEEAQRGDKWQLRHRIEHVQIYHPDDRDRLAQLNVIASMQPTHAVSDMEMVSLRPLVRLS
jgi:predicted amidohydrolase YtcJ